MGARSTRSEKTLNSDEEVPEVCIRRYEERQKSDELRKWLGEENMGGGKV
jgi:hypothetical protein